MKVKITKAFDSSTHKMPETEVGKIKTVDDELGAKWVKAGYAVDTDPATPATPPATEVTSPEATQRAAATPATPPATEVTSPEATQRAAETPEKPLGSMRKAELLMLANERNVEASESDTVADLVAKLS